MVRSISKHDVEEVDTAPSPHAEGGVGDGRQEEPLCVSIYLNYTPRTPSAHTYTMVLHSFSSLARDVVAVPSTGSSACSMVAAGPSRCAIDNTVIGTVASASFLPGLHALANSAHALGFRCVVVQAFDWFDGLKHVRFSPLPIPEPPLLPRPHWCTEKMSIRHGWRRSQLYRSRMWRAVLEMGLDLLALDLDWNLGNVPPLRLLRMAFAPAQRSTAEQPPTPQAARRATADVVAVWDGPNNRYLNVGNMWVRSTMATIELARRSENRSFTGWEQQVFNEELNFNPELLSVRCCHTVCLKRIMNTTKISVPKNDKQGLEERVHVEGRTLQRCSNSQPPTLLPPSLSRESWANAWDPTGVYEANTSKHAVHRKYGRCNLPENACVQVDESSGDASPLNCTSIRGR